MLSIVKNLLAIIDPSDRRRMVGVLVLTIIMAVVEALGVASIMPFLTVASNPGMIRGSAYLNYLYTAGEFTSERSFLIALGVLTFVILVGSICLRMVTQWVQTHFLSYQVKSIGCRLVGGYLRQPYAWFLDKNSSELGTKILMEVGNAVHGALTPALQGAAHALVSVALIVLLFIVDPLLATAAAVGIGGVYVGLYLLAKRRLAKIGVQRMKANLQRNRVLHEVFGGIKDVKIAGLESHFLKEFEQPSEVMARRGVSSGIITELPSHAMQGLVFGGTLLMILYLITVKGGIQGALPVIAVYGFASYRLLPALQGIYRGIGGLRVYAPVAASLRDDLAEIRAASTELPPPAAAGLGLKDYVEFRNVTYRYPSSERDALHSVSVKIPARNSVGIVGSTGSGKTTFVDVLLGLLTQRSGEILVDGRELTPALLPAWQRSVGYVPQQIFLLDASIAENVAFGVAKDKIDHSALERAARAANLHDFVMEELPERYDTIVGDRGVRFSGGQRQRIGIARALYRDPDILIFDEATSALDGLTEQAVMEAINHLGGQKTIVIIAHRLSTIRKCDEILLLDKGRIAARGTYDDLVEQNAHFKAMTRSGT